MADCMRPRRFLGPAFVPCHAAAGFTLIEVLVALSVMALMALMSWQAIDGMVRTQERARAHTDDTLTLQAAFAQWRADLDTMSVWPQQMALLAPAAPEAGASPAGAPGTPAPAEPLAARSLDWDGRVLRITRLGAQARPVAAAPGAPAGAARLPAFTEGLRVAAWARTPDGMLWHWQSPPLHTWGQWAAAWQAAQRWGQSPGARPNVLAAGVQAVPVLRVDEWQLHYFLDNAWFNPLSSSAQNMRQLTRLPEAVRLQMRLSPDQALTGLVAINWLSPAFTPASAP